MTMHALDPGLARSTDLSPFRVFALIYATAILLELMESWRNVPATLIMLALTALLVWRTTLPVFAALLVVSNAYFVFFQFPEVANHVNLTIFASTAILLAIAVRKLRNRNATEDEVFLGMQPSLRLLIIATFTIAGFHKFNSDFVDPEASCARWFAGGVFRALGADFLDVGVPAAFAIAVVVLASLVLFFRVATTRSLPAIDWPGIATPVIALLLMGTVVLAVAGTERIGGPVEALFFAIAIAVLCWQLVEGPLLLVPRFQWVALAFSIVVHATIAMFMVVDFQAIAVALLVTFVPPEVWNAWRVRSRIAIGRLGMNRAVLYLLLNLLAGLVMLVHFRVVQFLDPAYVAGGLLFNIGLLVLLWPILVDLFARDRRWRWNGVAVLHPLAPRVIYLLPVLLVAFGLTSHLGLRTAGNFSMFSNLRTEGPVSNHLILRNNPWKLWAYQEDVVEIMTFDRMKARIGHQYALDEGLQLPVVEFRKLLYLWRENAVAVPMTLRYRGDVVVSTDIARDPAWRVDAWDWEMRLMDFRVIQPGGPNRCRW